MKHAKQNRQVNREVKNMSKSVRLDAKKGINRMIKELWKNPKLSFSVKQNVNKVYLEIKLKYTYKKERKNQ